MSMWFLGNIFRTTIVAVILMVATPCLYAQDYYDDGTTTEAFDEFDGEVDSLVLAKCDSLVAHATVITPEELDSPMMNIIEVAEVKTTLWDNMVAWVMDHLFISTLLGNLLIAGIFWLIYRIQSALT